MVCGGLELALSLTEGGFFGLVHLLGLILAQAAAEVREVGLDAVLLVLVQLSLALGEGLIDLVGQHFGLIVQVEPLLAAAVLGFIGSGVRHRTLDLILREVGAAGNGDVLLPAGAEVFGRDLDDAVHVDVKGDFDLRLGGEACADAGELELAQRLVIPCKMAFALQDVDLDAGLHRACGRENLALARRDHAVPGDEGRCNTTHRLNGQGERCDIHQDKALCRCAGGSGQLAAALKQTALNRRAHGNALIGVQAVARLLAEQFLDLTLHGRHPGAAADQQDFAQLAGRDTGVTQGVLDRLDRPCQQVSGHHLELGPGDGQVEVVGAVLADGDKGQVQLSGRRAGQFFLGFFGFLFQAAHCGRVTGEVDAVGFFELRHSVLDDALVEVVAAEVGVAAGRQNGEGAVLDLNDGDIEGSAAEIVDEDFLGGFVIQTVGDSGGSRLVDDAQDIQTGNASCVLRGLALAVVKVGRNRDDGFGDRFAQIALGIVTDLRQDHRADLLRRQVAAVNVNAVIGTHVPFDAGDGAAGVGRDLAFCRAADQTLTVFRKGDDTGGRALALRVGDDDRLSALDHRNAGVGGAKVDSDYFAHTGCPLFSCDARIFPKISYRFRMTIS